ncbi:DUF1294 domain-containing protein [Wansuia hejianensis]|uniref:DUF1294 domain-containing protein n=1 Tax=Wansuia hejianensis TaxID=2763667 RepID=UPI0020163776|nr:DUF1294 domain-containing protein [Wansuia hejianensis]
MDIRLSNIRFIILIYIFTINIVGFIAFGIDKKRARDKTWRIPESTLFILSLLGGATGNLLGMKTFRHKTQKKKFTMGIPIILLINIFTFVYILHILL